MAQGDAIIKKTPKVRTSRGVPDPKGIAQITKRLRGELRKNHDPVRAVNEKRYLKSPYKFFGVPVPILRTMARGIRRDNKDAPREFIFALAHELWRSPYHQEKSLAFMVLEQYPQYLDMDAMPTLESMLNDCTGWDHTDWIATALVARVLEKDSRACEYLKLWGGSNPQKEGSMTQKEGSMTQQKGSMTQQEGSKTQAPLWVRRASLISQIPLLRKGQGDRKLFFTLAEGMLADKDFFIRKAIGWTIREVAKSDPGAARDFLMSIKGRASGLTLREGAKRLPEGMKKEVLA